MVASMTQEERTRVYCCVMACPHCGAKRGEFCVSKRGKVWTKGFHADRSPGTRARNPLRPLYLRLKAQVLAARMEDHEMREG